VEVEFWSAADTKGEVSSGRSENEWILGERFIQERFKGSIGGEEYTGLGILGYDNGARRFRSVWMDSLNTALTTASGRYLADTHSFEFESLIYDPLIGGERSVRSYITFKGADRYTVTMLTRDTEGREFKSLEMRYQRLGS
jgi:hypothetical protein